MSITPESIPPDGDQIRKQIERLVDNLIDCDVLVDDLRAELQRAIDQRDAVVRELTELCRPLRAA